MRLRSSFSSRAAAPMMFCVVAPQCTQPPWGSPVTWQVSGKADVHLLEPRLTDCDENSHGFWKGSARGLDALRLTRSGECVSLRARY